MLFNELGRVISVRFVAEKACDSIVVSVDGKSIASNAVPLNASYPIVSSMLPSAIMTVVKFSHESNALYGIFFKFLGIVTLVKFLQ